MVVLTQDFAHTMYELESGIANRRISRACTAIVIAGAVLGGSYARADEAPRWAEEIESAKNEGARVTDEDVAAAVADLRQSMSLVYKYIGGESVIGRHWQSYLDWDDQVDKAASGSDQGSAFWLAFVPRVLDDAAGLDHASFSDYRHDLLALIDVLEAKESSDLQRDYIAAIDRLANALPATERTPTPEEAREISASLAFLHRIRQAKAVTSTIQKEYSRNNLVVTVPTKIVRDTLGGEHVTDAPVNTTIDNAVVRGDSHITTHYSAHIPESDSGVQVALHVEGVSESTTSGYRSGVTVRNASVLRFASRAEIALSEGDIRSEPFSTSAQLRSQILGVCSNKLGLQRLIAKRRALRRKCIADREAESQAIRELNREFNSQLNEKVAPIATQYRTMTRFLQRRSLAFRRWSSVRDGVIRFECLLNSDGGIAAPDGPPSLSCSDAVIVSIHESALSAMLGVTVAGRRLPLQNVLDLLTAGTSADAREPEGGDEVVITFAAHRPVEVVCEERQVTVVVRGSSFEVGGQVYAAMDVELCCRLTTKEGEWVLETMPPRVLMPRTVDGERARVGIRSLALRRILVNAINRDRPETIALDSLLSEVTGMEDIGVKDLRIDGGWSAVALMSEEEGAER